jgi:iron complex transport system ATP-binding protein
VIALDRVSVTLGGVDVVSEVSASVEDGEWVALIGPNGAGKSSVLRAVLGLIPYRGRIEVMGEDASALGRRGLARRVAFVPQVPVMPDDMTVREYVLLGRTPHLAYLGRERSSDLAATARALARLELEALAERRLDSLSGGERQRATLARALAQDAPVLLLDEPTSALDVGRQQQALELVDALRRDVALTVLTAMHDLTLAAQYADRLLLLDGGRLVAGGPPRAVLTRPLIAEHYGADVRVVEEPDSGLVVVPVRRSS